MKTLIKAIVVSLSLALTFTAAAQAVQKTAHEVEDVKYQADMKAATAKLTVAHLVALKKIQSDLMKSGDLDGALAVRSEIKDLEAANPEPKPEVRLVAHLTAKAAFDAACAKKDPESALHALDGKWASTNGAAWVVQGGVVSDLIKGSLATSGNMTVNIDTKAVTYTATNKWHTTASLDGNTMTVDTLVLKRK